MAPHELLAHVRRTPFEPFRLVLADGAKYEIHHPDQCMVMKREVVIGEVSRGPTEFIDWTIKLNCFNVIRVEPLAVREPVAVPA